MAELVKWLAEQTADTEDQGSNPTRSGIENGGAERAWAVDGGGYFLKGGGFDGGEEGRSVI